MVRQHVATDVSPAGCTDRTSRAAGWVNAKRLPKGPNGRCLCRQCGEEVPKGRVTFCSNGCVDEWKVRTNPGYARKLVRDRDHGVCAICGLDTDQLVAELRRLRTDARRHDGFVKQDWRVETMPTSTYELRRETPFTQQ